MEGNEVYLGYKTKKLTFYKEFLFLIIEPKEIIPRFGWDLA